MPILLLGIVIAGTIIWLLRWINVLAIPKRDIYLKENASYPGVKLPSVSILVPARNEEENISECINSLIQQDYPDFEIIVINDRSIDRTLQILEELKARTFATKRDRLKILNISELPEGWTGKTNALYHGTRVAKGEWLLFTDADTVHQPLSLTSSIIYAIEREIELVSLYPQSRGDSFWEKITQPLGGGILTIWYPFEKVNNPRYKAAFANGQYILVKKKCYLEIGGHERVKGELLEDVAMAEIAKAQGKNIKMAYGFNIFGTRMYKNMSGIWKGWRRIFGVLMGKTKIRYPISLFLIIVFSFIPFAILFKVSFLSRGGIWGIIYFIDILEILFLYLTTASIYILSKNRYCWAIFYPLGCFIMFFIMLDALAREVLKRPIIWRGTVYRA